MLHRATGVPEFCQRARKVYYSNDVAQVLHKVSKAEKACSVRRPILRSQVGSRGDGQL